ncbi:RNA methyltransferase [Nanchangia anserum]|uniref:RNA methyltransferase n=1 Tax=Nanchangia anserum TaxID=2692125 RepID=A0A8I0GDG8_9ACTO|nr:RNA methyltransferase [Nanchangia anserum]MBD3688857.1 RNA methyltransferase [Nanchangia anserum]QOX81129.1 RNA methyltransferase [Nanchangia anserum]
MLVELSCLDDPRLTDYRDLTDVALRRVIEPREGLFMAESFTVITRALEAGMRPRSMLLTPRWLDDAAPLLTRTLGDPTGGDVPIFVGSEDAVRQLTGFRVHRGALAAMHRPPLPDLSELVRDAHRICVLEDLVDHTNVGAAFRSAAALGIDAIVCTPRCADPLYRRAVRVSMGTVFQVPWTRLDSWPATEVLARERFTTMALALSENSLSLDEAERLDVVRDPRSRLAVILGTEGDGLPARTTSSADYVVRIPMAGGVDSLNVAAAAAVTFWSLRPRNS